MDFLKLAQGLFSGIGAGNVQDLFGGVLHQVTTQQARKALKAWLAKSTDEACLKYGAMLMNAGTALLAKDREKAAGILARVVGSIKLR